MNEEDEGTAALQGVRIMILEDETLVAMLLEDMLTDLGCQVVASAGRVAQALEFLAGGEALDVAILDVNVAGDSSAPVAEALAGRDTPFVFATGYGETGVPEPWRGRPTLQKPFGIADVERCVKAAAGR